MKTFDKKHLETLEKFLIDNASKLGKENKISQRPYYPGNEKMQDYQWTVINILGLGKIEMYFTSQSSILSIDGVYVEEELIKDFNFRRVEEILLEKLRNKKIEVASKWIEKFGS